MNRILWLIPIFVFGVPIAYAEPLEIVNSSVIEYDGNSATVQLNWNPDKTVKKYEIGCVSCIPNFSEETTFDEITLDNIKAMSNGNALLYVIAFDDNDEIITAKQVILELSD